jgi:hypothetical protein
MASILALIVREANLVAVTRTMIGSWIIVAWTTLRESIIFTITVENLGIIRRIPTGARRLGKRIRGIQERILALRIMRVREAMATGEAAVMKFLRRVVAQLLVTPIMVAPAAGKAVGNQAIRIVEARRIRRMVELQ